MPTTDLISDVQLYDKYARWLPDEARRETWEEVTSRVMNFFIRQLHLQGRQLGSDVWDSLHEAMLQKDVLPSMRVVQMAGPALERCHVGAYNCAYLELDSPASLGELLYILMQGTGVGYSVEQDIVAKWPQVTVWESDSYAPRTRIADSTEGWCKAFVKTIWYAHLGVKVDWDYSAIRPEGSWLHTKGGRASGYKPLEKLLETTWTIIREARGRQLSSFEVHRLATMCGSIVQVGGVRRAAEIALFSVNDKEMAQCKDGQFWNTYPELSMANNSIVFESQPRDEEIYAYTRELAKTGTGEPGLFKRNGNIPKRRTRARFGTNPCGEIILRSRQFCNLSIAVARPGDSFEKLSEKVRLATILGTIQSTLTSFRYLNDEWKRNCEEERLLGVDITGTLDCELLQPSNPYLSEVLTRLREVAEETNWAFSVKMNIPGSAAVTCNKPSGNSSQLLNASSGIHPRYSEYYIRRLRIEARSPLAMRLVECGIPVFPEISQGSLDDARVWVFEFPVKSPEGSYTRHQLTAKQQLDYWLVWKKYWTEHNPSCTIYVEPAEWDVVAQFLIEHWQDIGGLAFLPKSNVHYDLAPYEEISKEEYERRSEHLPESLALDTVIELVDNTTVARDYACTAGGICEI